MITYKIVITTILATLIFLTACGVNNDDDPEITPDEPHQIADEERLQGDEIAYDLSLDQRDEDDLSLEQRIDNYIETYDQNIRGLSISIFTKDDMILEIEHGYADEEAELAIDSDAVFEWGALTKQLVWISVMQLYEREELDLHADIFTYISESDFPKIIYPTTMFHLMNHSAGFDDYVNIEFRDMIVGMDDDAAPTLEALLMDVIASEYATQGWQPGERVRFSIFGTILASYIVQQVSGVPFYEYVHSYVFAPLGMYQTALRPDMSDNQWVREQREEIKVYDMWGLQFFQRRQMLAYPTGAAVGTISDMVKFARALMPDENGGSVLFEHAETLSMLHPSHEDIQNAPICEVIPMNVTFFNGVGFFPDSSRDSESAGVIGHFGATSGFRVFWFIDIDRGVGMIMGENTSHGLAGLDGFFGFFTHEIPELALGI